MVAQSATASAPASIGNVGVGFDILGQAFDAARDTVTAIARGAAGRSARRRSAGWWTRCPTSPSANTALAAAQALLEAAGRAVRRAAVDRQGRAAERRHGRIGRLRGRRARPRSMPCSASRFAVEELLPFALEGERVASDPPPWDNVVASLLGGLVLGRARERRRWCSGCRCRPGSSRSCSTRRCRSRRDARARILRGRGADASSRSSIAAGSPPSSPAARPAISTLIRAGLEDMLVEPQRAHLLPALAGR